MEPVANRLIVAGRLVRGWRILWIVAGLDLIAIVFSARNQTQNSSVMVRNFYGVLTVRDLSTDQPDWRAYALFHGRIAHGYQFVAEPKRSLPTGYYGVTSGVGLALLVIVILMVLGRV
jgi:hypothetical protein